MPASINTIEIGMPVPQPRSNTKDFVGSVCAHLRTDDLPIPFVAWPRPLIKIGAICSYPFDLSINFYCSVNERIFPSGSLNHATFEPLGDVHTPRLSCLRKL